MVSGVFFVYSAKWAKVVFVEKEKELKAYLGSSIYDGAFLGK